MGEIFHHKRNHKRKPVESAELIKKLNRAADKRKEEQNLSDNGETTEGAKARSKVKGDKKGVSVRLKSETSDYEMNIRAARSKKNSEFYNLSVHMGSRFVGYVEVQRDAIVKLGKSLQQLE